MANYKTALMVLVYYGMHVASLVACLSVTALVASLQSYIAQAWYHALSVIINFKRFSTRGFC